MNKSDINTLLSNALKQAKKMDAGYMYGNCVSIVMTRDVYSEVLRYGYERKFPYPVYTIEVVKDVQTLCFPAFSLEEGDHLPDVQIGDYFILDADVNLSCSDIDMAFEETGFVALNYNQQKKRVLRLQPEFELSPEFEAFIQQFRRK